MQEDEEPGFCLVPEEKMTHIAGQYIRGACLEALIGRISY